jgi:ornithine decarboxylase
LGDLRVSAAPAAVQLSVSETEVVDAVDRSTKVALRRNRVREWLNRYAPAEAAAIAGAVSAAWLIDHLHVAAATAIAGAIGETLAFYVVIIARERRVDVRGLLIEFGVAESADTFLVRPLAMYVASALVGRAMIGVVLGKFAADVVFYGLAIIGYEVNRARKKRAFDPLTAPAIDRLPWRTPFLLMDLDRVEQSYHAMLDALGVDALHYAVKCNPDKRVLTRLHRAGCRFEIASYTELAQLRAIGVQPADVLYSNPVKPAEHIRRAAQAGCWRFAVDGPAELRKLAEHAPGSAVYVRLRTSGASGVPSEGKFGVDAAEAHRLLVSAAAMGLRPYGLTFHVGSQMTRPTAWAEAILEAGDLLAALETDGIRLSMLDIGGGFPARYADAVPDPYEYGAYTRQALDLLPYRPYVVAEPGRGLVADAGVLVSTVIGTATRAGRDWVHVDVGAFNGLMEALETGNTLAFPLTDSLGTAEQRAYHLTGPTCDSQDTIMFDAALSAGIGAGDRVHIRTAGAYTTAYAARFNGFAIPDVRIASYHARS